MQVDSKHYQFIVRSITNQIRILNGRRESLAKAYQYDKKFKTHKFEGIAYQNRDTTRGLIVALTILFRNTEFQSHSISKSVLTCCHLLKYLVTNDGDAKKYKKSVDWLLDIIIDLCNGQGINQLALNNKLHNTFPLSAFK